MTQNKSLRIITPMEPRMVKAIEDFRFDHRIDSRSEAIRLLIERALAEPSRPPGKAAPKKRGA